MTLQDQFDNAVSNATYDALLIGTGVILIRNNPAGITVEHVPVKDWREVGQNLMQPPPIHDMEERNK